MLHWYSARLSHAAEAGDGDVSGFTAPPVSHCRTFRPEDKLGQAFTQGSLEEIQSYACSQKDHNVLFLHTRLFLSDLI